MAKLTTEIFTLCDYASISQEQKLSIIGIFDQFFVQELPSSWPRMFLVATVKGTPNAEHNLTLRLTPPQKEKEKEEKFPDKDFSVKLGAMGKSNLITELVNFPLAYAGSYKISLLEGKEEIGKFEFLVNKTTPTYQSPDKIN